MNTMTSARTWTTRALIGVLALAGVEWIAAARAYRETVSAADWTAVHDALEDGETAPRGEPVLLAEPWLGPRARMEVPRLAEWDSVAPPDLIGAPRFHVLALGGRGWHDDLDDDLEGRPRPTATATRPLGVFTLYTYEQPGAGAITDSLLTTAALELRDELGRCRRPRAGARAWTCKRGKAAVETVEIRYRPRRCLALRMEDGARVTATMNDAELGDTLRGHVGFADYNARLRSDAPVQLTLTVDGATRGRWVFTDSQGWAAFEAETTPGTHQVELELQTTTSGIWRSARYDGRPAHIPCVELRALQGGGEAGA